MGFGIGKAGIVGLILLCSCASEPLTQEQIEEKEYIEEDRKIRYVAWEKACEGVIFEDNISGKRRGIPHRRDWRWDEKRDSPHISNNIHCVSQEQMRQILRRIMR